MKRIALVSLAVCACALTLGVAQTAHATVVKKATLGELVKGSQVIFHGVVRSVNDELATSPEGPFRTQIEFEVVTPVKGIATHQRTFALDLPGGRGYGRTMLIPGMPRFHVGDEVVLLLEATRRGHALAGLAQGVYFVQRTGGEPTVTRLLGGATYVDSQGHERPIDDEPTTLSGLLTQLRALDAGEVK